MEEQVPLVVSHTFRVVSEEADMTGEGGERTHWEREWRKEKRRRGKGEMGGGRRKGEEDGGREEEIKEEREGGRMR